MDRIILIRKVDSMKKTLSALLVLLLVLSMAIPASGEKNKADRSFFGNLFKLTTAQDFSLGEIDGLVIDDAVGNGALRLADGAAQGTYISDVIGVEPFEYLVASWNADVPAGTKIEIFARAYVDMHESWTGWMSWGSWSADIRRGSTEDQDELAYMDVDTLTISGSSGETASLVQVKAVLTAAPDGTGPVLRQIAATYKNTLDGQAITPAYWGETMELPASVRLDTPAYSQMIREAAIASSMCSATTVCVLLNDRGQDLLPEEIALMNYDKTYDGFGNWAFSAAAAGAFGYDAYCQYGSFDLLRQELAHGYSVGISVRYSNSQSGSYPYLENAPIGDTGGHLITITGYETIDGVDYFYSSDSAASSDAACFVRYRADQLDACWGGKLMYVVHDREDVDALAPNRVKAELVPAEGVENCYTLTVNGEPLPLDASFEGKMFRSDGGGIIAAYVEQAQPAALPAGVKTTSANRTMLYSIGTKDGLIRIDPADVLKGVTGGATVHVFVMMNNGVTYEAQLALEAAATPAPASTPEATEAAAPAATVEPTPALTEKPFISEENGNRLLIIAVFAIFAAVVVRYFIARKEQANKEKNKKPGNRPYK